MDDRTRKADKILAILQDFCDGELQNYTCLDLGCSRGIISSQLASKFKIVIGIDVDIVVLKFAQNIKLKKSKSPFFLGGDGYNLPFNNAVFDAVICAQVYEHVEEPQIMISEITRILKPGGICFFSGPNRLTIIEEHYWLPFLSWLPHRIASLYLRATKHGDEYDIYPLTYWQLNRMWKEFKIIDYSLKLLRDPKNFSIQERVEKFSFIKFVPNWILTALRPYYPNYNWIVVKHL